MPSGFQAFGSAEGYVGNKSFTPLDLGPALWLDAGQTGGVNGANLTTWTDLSGNGFHLNAQDAANVFHSSGGSNGTPYVTFSIGALYRATPLVTGADAARTCFVVTRRSADAVMCWYDGRYGSNGWGLAFGLAVSGKREAVMGGVGARTDTTSNATGNWEQICIINTGTVDQRMRVNEVAHALSGSGVAALSSTVRFSLGGNDNGFLPSSYVGDVSEYICYSSLLSDANIAKVEAYLLAKYAV
jgi:hypothetical protein